MTIKILGGLKVLTADPIETRLILSKEQMLATKDEAMPEVYFTICSEDGCFYLYNKANSVDTTLGKYRPLTGSAVAQVAHQIQREDAKPADETSVWDSLIKAQEYAFTSKTAYTGQVLYIKETDSFYKISKNEYGTVLLNALPDEKFVAEINNTILGLSSKIIEIQNKVLVSADKTTETLTLLTKLSADLD